MAKILFVNPVVREDDVPRHVPYGIALLAAIADQEGHLVQVFDQNAWRQPQDVVRRVFDADDWDVIAMGGITTTYGSGQGAGGTRPRGPTGYRHRRRWRITHFVARDIMTWLPDVDVGVVGEAFQTFPEILEMVDADIREWSRIHGTISRNTDGRLVMARQRRLLDDLDSLPYPAWDMFPLEEVYFKNSQALFSEEGMLATRRLDINASYGCSLICRFCYHLGIAGDMRYVKDADGNDNVAFDQPGTYTRTIRYHSPEYVVRLVKHAYDKYGIDFIGFLDENLMTMDAFSKRTWLAEICRLWKEYGLQPSYLRDGTARGETWTGVHWSGTSHATLCTKEILKEMRSAGCSHLGLRVRILFAADHEAPRQGRDTQDNLRSFFWSLEADIRPIPNQIIDFPVRISIRSATT